MSRISEMSDEEFENWMHKLKDKESRPFSNKTISTTSTSLNLSSNLSSSVATKGTYQKCSKTHPVLPVTVEGVTYQLHGGSARDPIWSDCDIYVALDGSTPEDKSFYPWNGGNKVFISFYITDMSTPKDIAEFKKMIEWLAGQVLAGKKVHVGCIGGHGRTGTVLSALVKQLTGNADAISYVRKHYCHKAVETAEQVNFLHAHFGCTKQHGAKSEVGTGAWKNKWDKPSTVKHSDNFNTNYVNQELDYITVEPADDFGSIWARIKR